MEREPSQDRLPARREFDRDLAEVLGREVTLANDVLTIRGEKKSEHGGCLIATGCSESSRGR